VAGLKGKVPVPGLFTDRIVLKGLTIRGAHGKASSSYARAIRILEAGTFSLHELRSRTYPMSAVRDAIDALAGRKQGEHVICVNLDPSA
jgi:threonine dehydrogenase-like Zn-dependent dehydrogenase